MKRPEEKKTNYSFLLKCMAGLTAAALITAGVLALIAAKVGIAGTGFAASAAVGLVAASAIGGPVGALAGIIGLAGFIAVVCLACCFGGARHSRSYASFPPSYGTNTMPGAQVYSNHNHSHPTRIGVQNFFPRSQVPSGNGSGSGHGHGHGNINVHGH